MKKTIVNHLYIWIWSFWLTFKALQGTNTNFKIGQLEHFCSDLGMRFWSKFENSLKLFNFVQFIKKTLVNIVYIRIWSSLLTFTVVEWMKRNFKISQICRFLLRSLYRIMVKIWKWLKLLNSVPFIKKTPVNHVYIRIWSSWLNFKLLQWMKTNFKISQFSRFLLRSRYAIFVKIWKWLKLLNSVPFMKKTIVNHLYIRIWSFSVNFKLLQWMKTNFKISQFSRFLLRSGYAILVKIWKWLKLHSCRVNEEKFQN